MILLYFTDYRGAVLAVEWSENVEDAFTGEEVRLTIEKLSDTARKITIEEGEHADSGI